jgi:hypothetical protein
MQAPYGKVISLFAQCRYSMLSLISQRVAGWPARGAPSRSGKCPESNPHEDSLAVLAWREPREESAGLRAG